MYAVRHLDIFVDAPLSLLSLNPGFLDPSSGYAIGFIAAIIYGNRRGIPFWPTMDALTPMFAVISVAYWLSQFASGDSYGIETQLPWGVQLWGANRHPTQIYYTINAVVNLGIIWSINKQRKHASYWNGKVFLTFLVLSSVMYLFWDAFRDDSKILLDGVRRTQVAAWFVLISSLIGINILAKARKS
jgi:prolipoprotein diacylglyceryltransferase